MQRTPEDEVILDVARLAVAASVRAADRVGGISPVQLRALTVIQELEESNLGEVAEELGVGVSTASRLMDRLVAQKLVDRRPSPRSRREISLRLSRRGESTLSHYDDLRIEELRRGLEAVPGDQRDTVVGALRTWLASVRPGADRGPMTPGIASAGSVA